MTQKLRLRTNNLTGFMDGSEYDGVVIDQPNARGRIQSQMTPTLNTSTGCGSGVIVKRPILIDLGISPYKAASNALDINGPAVTLTAPHNGIADPKIIEVKDMDRQEKQLGPLRDWAELKELIDNNKLTVRKLTPRECWRLMGMSDEDFEKAAEVSSDAQLYKQAGNSIVVDVLEAIFENILINGNSGQKSLMDY